MTADVLSKLRERSHAAYLENGDSMLVLVQAETWSQDLAPKLQYIKTDQTFGNSL